MESNLSSIIQLTIVSAEQEIFSGEVTSVFATGNLGELGIMPGHAPLITQLAPGEVRVKLMDKQEDVFYISGGMIEVLPNNVTVLSDTAIRAEDIDEAAAMQAKRDAEDKLAKREAGFEYSQAATQLARAVAQLRALQKIRKKLR